jgi:hypothetical protein
MPAQSHIDPVLIQAYRETEYMVLGGRAIVLRPDVFSPELVLLHQAVAVECSAFITACNAFSKSTDVVVNRHRQTRLANELAARGLPTIDAIGVHPSGLWPGEPSLLVPGLSLDDACRVGAQFDQNAIVWSGADAIPRVILLR